jgi:biotin-dependent carboxylase-like uncharacterized protein
MTTLRIARAGIHATVQDAGRSGYRALGVPGSGALDSVALHLANAVVGNSAGAAAVEILYSGMTVEVADGSARIAVGGASAAIERNDQTIALPAWQSAVVHAGDRVRVAAPVQTAAAYLAVEGGYAVPHVLGSASTYVQGRIGGYEGRALREEDELALNQAKPHAQCERRYATLPELGQPATLRVIPGPQLEQFVGDALERLLSSPYRVTPASNRSGLRLEGAALEHVAGHDLLSEGVATGSIQVPGSGQPVLLIGDHPTVGGYPKIATIISADLPAAGRLRIGSSVRFELASEQQAASARHAQRAWIAERLAALQSIA